MRGTRDNLLCHYHTVDLRIDYVCAHTNCGRLSFAFIQPWRRGERLVCFIAGFIARESLHCIALHVWVLVEVEEQE
jgi:hypothetical protein